MKAWFIPTFLQIPKNNCAIVFAAQVDFLYVLERGQSLLFSSAVFAAPVSQLVTVLKAALPPTEQQEEKSKLYRAWTCSGHSVCVPDEHFAEHISTQRPKKCLYAVKRVREDTPALWPWPSRALWMRAGPQCCETWAGGKDRTHPCICSWRSGRDRRSGQKSGYRCGRRLQEKQCRNIAFTPHLTVYESHSWKLRPKITVLYNK